MSILHIVDVVMSFKVTWKMHLLCFLIAYIIGLKFQNNISDLFLSLFLDNNIISFTGNDFIDINIFILLIFIPITFMHELLHGVTYKLFGGKVKYGFKGLYSYAHETSGIVLHRTKFLIVLFSPVTAISIASVFFPWSISGIVFILNLLGSTGNLLMTFYLCESNENSYIPDRSYGFDVIEKQQNCKIST